MSSRRVLRLASLASRPSLSTTYRVQAQIARPATPFQARHYAAKGEGEKEDRGGPGGQWPQNPFSHAPQNSYLGVVHGLGGYLPDLDPRTQRSLYVTSLLGVGGNILLTQRTNRTILNCVVLGTILTVVLSLNYMIGKAGNVAENNPAENLNKAQRGMADDRQEQRNKRGGNSGQDAKAAR